MAFLEPKEVEVTTLKGEVRSYIISKFPAIAGREIVAKYPLTAIPKVGDYSGNEAVMLQLMAYVAVRTSSGAEIPLTTKALIDNHVPDYETLIKIELEMMKYNTSFFQQGVVSGFLKTIGMNFLASITPMLTPSLLQLSEAIRLRLKNLNTNTP
jgi:hypothetical protein